MRILGIESSCDETAVSVVEWCDSKLNMLSNSIVSQIDIHSAYGGVVPEVAARSHIEAVIPTIDESLKTAFGNDKTKHAWDTIDGIAVTYGAGLNGSLLIGTLTARTLAWVYKKPLYSINHVEGHVYANFITSTPLDGYVLPEQPPQFPLLALIVSGGHSQLVLFKNHLDYALLGKTHDDAIGEAFDKVAKMTGLPYPGGPSVSRTAARGDAYAFDLPKAKMDGAYDFSFSGLKTAVLRKAQVLCGRDHTLLSTELPTLLSDEQVADIAAVFQRVAIETVVEKTYKAYQEYAPRDVVIAGGVASSGELRAQLKAALPTNPIYTDPKLCTDNGAMVAALGCFSALRGVNGADVFSLETQPALRMASTSS
jgi:N6-L-threonylcarbamoyladenine synthase